MKVNTLNLIHLDFLKLGGDYVSLNNIHFKYNYRSNEDQLYKDFYEPCLSNSIYYDRAAGYFSSHSLKTLAKGLEIFLYKDGYIRIIANPKLSERDIIAIEKGYEAKNDIIERTLLEEIQLTSSTIEDDTLNVLAWLIYNGQLEIKIAHTNNNALYHEKFGVFTDEYNNSVPENAKLLLYSSVKTPNNNALYHEKFGVFTDEYNNSVAFSGSANETYGGLVNNFEKVDVYFGEQDMHRIQGAKQDFESLWSNKTKGLSVINIPESVKQNLLANRGTMPHPTKKQVKKEKNSKIEIRDYQQAALQKVKENNWQGILEMATGTGKTITSLLIASKYKRINGRLFLVVYAPFTHLIEQWKNECELFGFKNITLCFDSKHKWLNTLEEEIRNYNIGILNTHIVITTYKTANTKHFKELIYKVADHS